MGELLIFVTIRRRQRLRCRALNFPVTIREHNDALERHFDAQSTARFIGGERRWQHLYRFFPVILMAHHYSMTAAEHPRFDYSLCI